MNQPVWQSRIRAAWPGMVLMAALVLVPAVLSAQNLHPAVASADVSSPQPAAVASGSQAVSQTGPQLEQRYPRYVIERQDVINLSFPLTPNFNQSVTVEPDGYIELQAVGSLRAQGLTVPELKAAVGKAYAHTLHNPIININLKNFQKAFFTVSGQVGKPGKYNLRTDLTVAEAIAVAGGLAPTAKTQILLFHHLPDHSIEVKKVNLKEILHGKDLNEDATLKPGDMIFVPEKFITEFKKYIPYSMSGGVYANPLMR